MQYGYDPVGRLQNVWRNDTLVSTYSYDPNGNRIAHWPPAEIDSGTYDAQDRMLSYGGTQYIYSRNGDLETKIAGTDTTDYSYDAFGNLTQVVMPPKGQANGNVIQYVINGQNRRIAKKVNGTITNKWLYAGQLTPVAELDSANNIIARFCGGFMNKRDTIYQIITDHLGSPRLVVNVETGAVVQRMDYDEFGNVIYDSNPGFQPFGFAGGLYDPETKLVRFGARDYDAAPGRWTSKDPIGFNGGYNLYTYAVGDPVNKFDPMGTCGPNSQSANWLSQFLTYGSNFLSTASGLYAEAAAVFIVGGAATGTEEIAGPIGAGLSTVSYYTKLESFSLQLANYALYNQGNGGDISENATELAIDAAFNIATHSLSKGVTLSGTQQGEKESLGFALDSTFLIGPSNPNPVYNPGFTCVCPDALSHH